MKIFFQIIENYLRILLNSVTHFNHKERNQKIKKFVRSLHHTKKFYSWFDGVYFHRALSKTKDLIFTCCVVTKRYIKNWVKYHKFLLKDADYDQAYMYHLLVFKMKNIYKRYSNPKKYHVYVANPEEVYKEGLEMLRDVIDICTYLYGDDPYSKEKWKNTRFNEKSKFYGWFKDSYLSPDDKFVKRINALEKEWAEKFVACLPHFWD